jgi:intraflagellar transport protein 81
MEKIALIVERLNQAPFNKEISTMTELDSKSGFELTDIMCEIVVAIDSEQEGIFKEPMEYRVGRIMNFLNVMKFSIPAQQFDDFQDLLLNGDKEILYAIMFWSLQKFDHLKKRAYLAKFLMPVEVPADFQGEDLILELSQRLKELQAEFKEVHKAAEQVRSSGIKPADLKQEIAQLEQERSQLNNKIQRMKKDIDVDEDRFKDMLKATSALRKEQENEVLIHERLREHRKAQQEAELRHTDTQKRFHELKTSGILQQSAEYILNKLQNDVKELIDRREHLGQILLEREQHLDKLLAFDNNSQNILTEDDIRNKRENVQDLEDHIASLTDRLEVAMEKNTKLVISRQACSIAQKKYREIEDETTRLQDEVKRMNKQIDDKEHELRNHAKGMSAGNSNKITKKELKRFGQVVKEKIDVYKKLRDDLSALRAELVVLQRTEQVLKSRDANLEQFLVELEKQKGVEVSPTDCVVLLL